jgi:hypothetical protein
MLGEGQRLAGKSEFRSFKMRKLAHHHGLVRVDLGSSESPLSAYGMNHGENPEVPGRFVVELIPPVQHIETGEQIIFVNLPAKNIHIARSQSEVVRYRSTHPVRMDQGARITTDTPQPSTSSVVFPAKLN